MYPSGPEMINTDTRFPEPALLAVRAASSGLITAASSGPILDQLLGSHAEDIKLGTADDAGRLRGLAKEYRGQIH